MPRIPRFVLLLSVAAAASCAGSLSTARQSMSAESPTERLGRTGVSPAQRSVESGSALRFVNDDVRSHEIYSSDCRELASTPLAPGAAFVAQLEPGPKLCHFQDLLAPSASEFWGTVEVAEPPPPQESNGG